MGFVRRFSRMSEPSSNPPSPVPLPNPLAAASLWLGIVSVVLFALMWVVPIPFFWLASIIAIVFGYAASGKIGRTFGPVAGARAARAGLWLGWIMTLGAPVIVALLLPTFSRTCAKGNMTKAINNCRQIITVLRLYSSDHDGHYPDFVLLKAKTSNEIFHELFEDGACDNELIFGAPLSPFVPDGNIGSPSDFVEAVKPGENAWAMTKGLTDTSPGDVPLVYEAPSVASWPPRWNARGARDNKPGTAWSNGKVILGMNDASVQTWSLESPKGENLPVKTFSNGLSIFPPADRDNKDRPYSVLNVAR